MARKLVPGWGVGLLLGVVLPGGLHIGASGAVGQTPGPEAVAERFFFRLGRLQWAPMAELLHPEVLKEFDLVAHQLVESLRGDSVLTVLYGSSRTEFEGWSDLETFVRSMVGMTDYARGLMESQVASDVEILGSVEEGDGAHHVVYRKVTDHMGLQTEGVSVVSLRRANQDWRIRQNVELEILKTALRGLPIAREPPT